MKGWMVIFRPDTDAEADGVDEEVFNVIYRRLDRAKIECSRYLPKAYEPDQIDPTIDWALDSSSTPKREVWFGRPRASVDGMFYLYEMEIE